MTSRPIKCVIVGDSFVGKSYLLYRYIKKDYPNWYCPTVFENYSTDVAVDGKLFELKIFDTAGYDDYDRLRPLSYPETNIFLLCFSVENSFSFSRITSKWYPEVRLHCPTTPIILVGLKNDIRDDPKILIRLHNKKLKPVMYQQGFDVAEKIGAVKYLECSALNGNGVDVIFEEIVRAAGIFGNKVDDVNRINKCNLL